MFSVCSGVGGYGWYEKAWDRHEDEDTDDHRQLLSANTLIQRTSRWRWADRYTQLIHLSEGMLGKTCLLPTDKDLSHTELQSLHRATLKEREAHLFSHIQPWSLIKSYEKLKSSLRKILSETLSESWACVCWEVYLCLGTMIDIRSCKDWGMGWICCHAMMHRWAVAKVTVRWVVLKGLLMFGKGKMFPPW